MAAKLLTVALEIVVLAKVDEPVTERLTVVVVPVVKVPETLEVTELEVEALVVEALLVMKLDDEPKRELM